MEPIRKEFESTVNKQYNEQLWYYYQIWYSRDFWSGKSYKKNLKGLSIDKFSLAKIKDVKYHTPKIPTRKQMIHV